MILVFGKSGQLATALGQGADLVCLGRDQLVTGGGIADAIASHAPRAVINAAAYTNVDGAELEPNQAKIANCDMPRDMARACAARGIPLVHVSTDYVFDGSGDRPWQPDDITGPINTYGQSKLDGERAITEAGGVHAILRTAWVFSGTAPSFVSAMLRLGTDRETLNVVADQVGGPTAATDLARACQTIADRLIVDPDLSGTYHYAGAPEVTRADFARAIMAEAGLTCGITDIKTSEFPTPAPRPLNSRMDCTSLTAAFGIERPDWRRGLADAIHSLKQGAPA